MFRRLFVCVVLGLLVTSLFSPFLNFVPNVKATTFLTSGWESSGGTDLTDNGAWSEILGSGGVITSSTVYQGAYAMQVIASSGDFMFLFGKEITPSSTVYVQFYYRVSTKPTSDTWTILVEDEDENGWWVRYGNDAGTEYMRLKIAGTESSEYPVNFGVGCWQCIKAEYQSGNNNLWINGSQLIHFTQTTVLTVSEVVPGESGWASWSHNAYFDSVTISTTDIGGSTLTCSNVGTNSTIAGNPIQFYSKWTTTANYLSKFRTGTNNSGSWVWDSWYSFPASQTIAWATYNATLNSNVGYIIQWEQQANTTTGETQTTGNRTFTVVLGSPTYDNFSIVGVKAGATTSIKIRWLAYAGTTLSMSLFSWNSSGSYSANVTQALSGTSAWHNLTQTVSSTVSLVIGIKFCANSSVGEMTLATFTFVTMNNTMMLHTANGMLVDETGKTVYLRGVGKIHFDDDPTGWWDGNYNNYVEATVVENLQNMKIWGLDHVRIHTNPMWWLAGNVTLGGKTTDYHVILKRLAYLASVQGLYVIMDCYNWGIPALFSDGVAFTNYWGNFTEDMRPYANVIFELYNEPDGTYAQEVVWMGMMQDCITRIRSVAVWNPIIVEWGIARDPIWTISSWALSFPLTDTSTNLVYSGHGYWVYDHDPGWDSWYGCQVYSTLYVRMEQTGYRLVHETLGYYTMVGEFGVDIGEDSASDLVIDLAWANNTMTYCNLYDLGYSAWNWIRQGDDIWYMFDVNHVPNVWAKTIINRVHSHPFVWSAGTTSDMYSNNTAYSVAWTSANSTLKITYTGACYSRIYWNGSSTTYPLSASTLKAYHSNSSVFLVMGYYSYSTNLITLYASSSGTWTISYSEPPPPPSARWKMTFLPKDINNIPISAVTWSLFNGTQQLSYTNGSVALLDGFFTLKIYYAGYLINSTSLNTATYGNATITINLSMKALTSVSSGYIAFNQTLTSITLTSDTSTNITAVTSGYSGACRIILKANQNASSIKRNGVAQTGWVYSGGYITLNTSSLSTWEYDFIQGGGSGGGGGGEITMRFIVFYKDLPVKGCFIKVYERSGTVAYDSKRTEDNGVAEFYLPSGEYRYYAEWEQKTKNGTFMLTREQEIKIKFVDEQELGLFSLPRNVLVGLLVFALIICAMVVIARKR